MPTKSRSSVPPSVAAETCWLGHVQTWEPVPSDPLAWHAVCRECGEEITIYLPESEKGVIIR